MIAILITLAVSATHICYASTYDHYLLSCGPSTSLGRTFDGRDWSTDENTIFSSFSSFTTTSTVASISSNLSTPFIQARIFKSSFTCTFPVSPVPKFLHLFFYTDHFDSPFNASNFFISAQANHHLLLTNFTVLNITTTPHFIIKEYYINIPSNETYLNLTLSPALPRSYAFLNGIEVVSIPLDLYVSSNGKPIINVDNPKSSFDIAPSTALETAYRINVGGPEIPVETDGQISGMYRGWENDENYTFLDYGEAGFLKLLEIIISHVLYFLN